MTQYDESLVLADLESQTPDIVIDLFPPYIDGMSDHQKLKELKVALRRSIKVKNRQTSLINAYFLGKLFEDTEVKERETLRPLVSDHYYNMGRNTYDLFEGFPKQIYRTSYLSAQIIKKLRRSKVLQYRETLLNHFVGTQNLVGEDCHGDDLVVNDVEEVVPQ